MTHIAVIGAGFTGMAIAWHLLKLSQKYKITIFDPLGIGGGTSGIAAGLLHPFAGAHAKLNWRGLEGMQASQLLLDISSNAMGRAVYKKSGLLRLALSEAQISDFQRCAERHPEVSWYDRQSCCNLLPTAKSWGGIWIDPAFIVNSSLYLEGLWVACQQNGATLEKQKINRLHELSDFDKIIVAAGAACQQFSELSDLSITPVKGQVLELKYPAEMEPLSFPINSQGYLLGNPNEVNSCLAGSTFERSFTTTEPDIEIAKREILPKILDFLPALNAADIIDCKAGIRASTPNHRPLMKRLNERLWVLTGMGSKGLLYHALFAELVAADVVSVGNGIEG